MWRLLGEVVLCTVIAAVGFVVVSVMITALVSTFFLLSL